MTRAHKSLLKRFLESLFALESSIAKSWSSSAHRRLMLAQWSLKPAPDHFDHHIDLHHQWMRSRNPMWLERGVFSALALKGGDVLELSCGDGFNARNFYSLASRIVVGCDIDDDALTLARRKNSATNIEYVNADIRVALPPGRFDNVVWDFAFPLTRYFSLPELTAIFARIKAALTPQGMLSGYTLADTDGTGSAALVRVADLRTLLAPHFANVTVFETRHPGRLNFYFWASDGGLPLVAPAEYSQSEARA